ncbi:MAG: arginine--tRNA ligase [Desulfovibrionaceae bacterium]
MRAKQHLETLLKDFVRERGFTWPDKAGIEPPKDRQFGDMATNLAMVLSGQAKKKPRDLAEEIKAAIEARDASLTLDIAGPGFLNVTFMPAFWQRTVTDILDQGDRYGAVDVGKGRKVQVEYVSANPTGPLHIGHGRGAATGDSLARILRFTGHDVTTEYYINDAGRQMRLLGMSVWVRLQQSQGKDIPLPEDSYKGDYIMDIAADVLRDTPGIMDLPEAEAVDICRRRAMDDILAGIRKDLEDFGCEHQVWYSEQSLLDAGGVDKAFKLLTDAGKAFEKDGAFWFRSTEYGDDKDRVLRKSDGLLTYFASDIAYHADKYQRGFDLVVDIWGADHHGYIPRMTAAVQALGKTPANLKVILVQLVNLLRGGEQIAMSTRAGMFETLADVVAEVGADAARFIFLSRKSDSHLDFDLELVKRKSMDNPVYYVQYAHARICSVLRKAEERGVAQTAMDAAPLDCLDTPEDLNLLRQLERFPDALAAAAENQSPHHVSFYLSELASALHRYYTVNHILGVDDEAVMQARLRLVRAVAQVIRNGLALLGVSAPETM